MTAIGRRVNPGGQKEVTIRQYGPEQIEIIIPDVTDTEKERIKEIVSKTGKLEFRIVANRHNQTHKEAIEMATERAGRKTYLPDAKELDRPLGARQGRRKIQPELQYSSAIER